MRGMRTFAVAVVLLFACVARGGEPSLTGQTGLVSMPDARIAPEGSWRTGMSLLRPYQALWTSVAVLPWFEPSFRFTRIMGVPGFDDPERARTYGDFKDKSFDFKVRLLPESEHAPALALGVQDAQGTRVFRAFYAAASKRLGELDLTLGYGTGRLDGVYGGLRWSPRTLPGWHLVAEYDAYEYARDRGASQSGAAAYRKGPAFGVEYRWNWLGANLFAAHGQIGFNAFVSVPLQQKEFVPKIHEPEPWTRLVPRPTEAQWEADASHRARLERALALQDFRDVRVHYENGVLSARLANARISSMPRAVGRAARTLLAFAPLEVREIRITYLRGVLPLATYSFVHAPTLQRYFNGLASRSQLAQYVAIEYAKPEAAEAGADLDEALAAASEALPDDLVTERREYPAVFGLQADNVLGGRVRLAPSLSTFLNDPSGAFKFDLSAIGSYERSFPGRLFVRLDTKLALVENVSDVTQPSNSLLPHVRSDVAEYKRGGRFKIMRLLANQYFHPAERLYGRASIGIYEEMYSGAGGQLLYLPKDGRWAADVAVDWLRQRDFRGLFGHRDYSTVTAIGSLHYRMAHGITGTLRAGRFLARDEGVRFEMKRRFASGFEVGAWYTITNGRDITAPGSPANPYHDKGVFIAMPLHTMLTRDTPAVAGIALAPWTRDVGQMVASPGDLYRMLETPVLQRHERDGLQDFGDREDDPAPEVAEVGRERRWPEFLVEDAIGLARAARRVDWAQTLALGGAITYASSALDGKAWRFSERHRGTAWLRGGVRLGNALPAAALALSGLFAFDESRPRLSDAGVAALEASALAALGTEALKHAFGRARPGAGGRGSFEAGSSDDRFHSLPSRHAALMWAAVTPYAREFGADWLYGVAALTNLARVGSRRHWVSDTVAGALLGHALGELAWQARRSSRAGRNGPQVAFGSRSVQLSWALD